MSTTVNNPLLSTFQYLQPSTSNRRIDSFQQVAAQVNEANITVVTDEGDIVSISSALSQAGAFSVLSKSTLIGNEHNFTAASLESEFFSLSVQGDLSEEELDDINNLLHDLTDIAEDFFLGNLDEALAEAMDLGSLGSLSRFSSTFTRTTVVSSALTTSHPLPVIDLATDAVIEDLFGLPETLKEDGYDYADNLRSQWEQIKEYLDNRENEISAARVEKESPSKSALTPSEKMLERAEKTITKQPRLSPFIVPLANRAIERTPELPTDAAQLAHWQNQLKRNFLNDFSRWLVSV